METYHATDCYFALQRVEETWEVVITPKSFYEEEGHLLDEEFELSGDSDLELEMVMESCFEPSFHGNMEFTFAELKKHCEEYGLTFCEDMQEVLEESYMDAL